MPRPASIMRQMPSKLLTWMRSRSTLSNATEASVRRCSSELPWLSPTKS